MAVKLAPVGNDAPYVDSNGNPLSGGLLYFYTAGSSTPQDTYTTSAGTVVNANPVVLDSAGYPASGGSVVEIWFTSGVSYKAVLKTSAGVTLWTRDNLSGINDTTVTLDQWVSGPTPTYVSATQFTLVGDQTSTFHVGRRVKTTNSGGTIYSTISASAFGVLTTVTVVNDTGTLDSGLSAVNYGLLTTVNPSLPAFRDGSASIPSIVFASDPDTGFYWVSANSFAAAAGGSATGMFTNSSGNKSITLTTATSGAFAEIGASNSSNTASSQALLSATVAGSSAADPYAKFVITGGSSWAIGADNSDSDSFKISQATTLGTNDFVSVSTAGLVTLTGGLVGGITLATMQASTSGSSINYTSIPAGTKKIVISFVGVSTNGTADLLVQIGDSGGLETSGYLGSYGVSGSYALATTGFGVYIAAATDIMHGTLTLSLVDAATFTWTASGVQGTSNAASISNTAGSKSLSAELDRLSIVTTDTFDAGSINIQYER